MEGSEQSRLSRFWKPEADGTSTDEEGRHRQDGRGAADGDEVAEHDVGQDGSESPGCQGHTQAG